MTNLYSFMPGSLKPIFLMFCMGFSLLVTAQSPQLLIQKIRENFSRINADTSLKKITIDGMDFLDDLPDGGLEITGFYKKDTIVKIVEWVGLSYGNQTREYYLNNKGLFFVYEKFESFLEDREGGLDHSKVKTSFEGRYYLSTSKIMEQKTSGKKTMEEEGKDKAKELRTDANRDIKWLLQYGKHK